MSSCRISHRTNGNTVSLVRRFVAGMLMVLAGLLTASPALANDHEPDHQDLELLRQQVDDFLRTHYDGAGIEKLEVEVGRLDSRLRLAACEQPLAMSFNDPSSAGGSLTIHTRCLGPAPWALYVPAQVDVYRAVAVASRSLGRGHRIGEGDIDLELRNTGRLRQGFVTGPDSILNKELRRPLKAGEAFRLGVVVEPLAVERGDQVRLQTQAGPITVDTTGTALSSGRTGEQIRVRNDRSERVVRGRIVAPGRVEVVL